MRRRGLRGSTAAAETALRADMCLPDWVLLLGIVLGVGAGLGLICAALYDWNALLLASFGLLALSLYAVLCWKNQTIRLLDGERFVYRSFLGTETEYAFADIRRLRRNADSWTLFVGDGKVHIDFAARLSEPLVEKLEERLFSRRKKRGGKGN